MSVVESSYSGSGTARGVAWGWGGASRYDFPATAAQYGFPATARSPLNPTRKKSPWAAAHGGGHLKRVALAGVYWACVLLD